jgi:hypothetical protein
MEAEGFKGSCWLCCAVVDVRVAAAGTRQYCLAACSVARITGYMPVHQQTQLVAALLEGLVALASPFDEPLQ